MFQLFYPSHTAAEAFEKMPGTLVGAGLADDIRIAPDGEPGALIAPMGSFPDAQWYDYGDCKLGVGVELTPSGLQRREKLEGTSILLGEHEFIFPNPYDGLTGPVKKVNGQWRILPRNETDRRFFDELAVYEQIFVNAAEGREVENDRTLADAINLTLLLLSRSYWICPQLADHMQILDEESLVRVVAFCSVALAQGQTISIPVKSLMTFSERSSYEFLEPPQWR